MSVAEGTEPLQGQNCDRLPFSRMGHFGGRLILGTFFTPPQDEVHHKSGRKDGKMDVLAPEYVR